MITRILIVIVAVCLASCFGNNEKKATSGDLKEATKPGTVQKEIIYAVNEFSGKVYLVGTLIDDKGCEIERACDCCNSEILFLTDSTFILSSYCIPDEIFAKGKYVIQANSLILKYDSLEVTNEYNENEIDSLNVSLILKAERKHYPDTKFKITRCNEKALLVVRYKGGKEYGKEFPEKKLATEVQALKENGIWQKLEID